MASKKFSNGSDEWFMFTTFWKICQEHWVPESSEEYWQKVIDDCHLFNDTFKEIGFAKFLAVALIDYLEAKNK